MLYLLQKIQEHFVSTDKNPQMESLLESLKI
jgi:hypothetical protein